MTSRLRHAMLRASGASGVAVVEFPDISTFSYDGVFLDVSSQDATPLGVALSSDGTRLFAMGAATNFVYQYTMSTANDLTTAVYDNVSFSVAPQDTFMQDVAFSIDGTKMFAIGFTDDVIYQYTLSTGYDLTTASYDNVSFSVTDEDTTPTSVTFSPDGTKMFVVGYNIPRIHQYTLSTGYDLTTASSDLVRVGVPGLPYNVAFNPQGTLMFVVDSQADEILQYSLSTAFDLTTAVSVDSLSTASEDTSSISIAFSSDGSRFFLSGAANDNIYQYSSNA